MKKQLKKNALNLILKIMKKIW